jgi:hypothetical protein
VLLVSNQLNVGSAEMMLMMMASIMRNVERERLRPVAGQRLVYGGGGEFMASASRDELRHQNKQAVCSINKWWRLCLGAAAEKVFSSLASS